MARFGSVAQMGSGSVASDQAQMSPEDRARSQYLLGASNPADFQSRYLSPLAKYKGAGASDAQLQAWAPQLLSGQIPNGWHLNGQGQLQQNSQYRSMDFWGPMIVGGAIAAPFIAGAVAGGAAAGAGSGAAGAGGATAAGGVGASMTPAAITAAGMGGAVPGVGMASGAGLAAAGGAGGSFMSGMGTTGMGTTLASQGIGSAFQYAGGKGQANAAKYAGQLQADAANHAADLQAQASADALKFQQQQAALTQQNYLGTQAFNRQVYTDQQNRLAPYRALGAGSIMQIGQAMPQGNTTPFQASGVR